MKKLYYILFFASLLFTQDLIAQVPQGFNYQAVARDINDNIIKDDFVSVRFWLLEDNSSGTPIYRESHESVYTGLNGVITLVVGQGNSEVGDFSTIDWGSKEHFLRVDLDPDGGTNYSQMGTAQLLTVPYAMFAMQSGNGGGGGNDNWGNQTVQTDNTLEGDGTNGNPLRVDVSQVNTDNQILSINGDQLSIDDGNTITLPTDGDGDSNNEIQSLSINGNDLTISDGNTISIPTGDTDADADPNNELQDLSFNWSGVNNNDANIDISNGQGITFSVDDGDSDSANELQDLDHNFSGNDVTVQISNGLSTTFSIEDDDSDDSNEIQTLTLNGNNLSISNGNTISIPMGGTDADADPNNELQDLDHSFTGNDVALTITNGIGTTFSIEDDDSDDENELQDLDVTTTGTDVDIDISNGTGVSFSIEDDDSDDENELQDLDVTTTGTDVDIDISDGTGVTFSIEDDDSDETNELQDLDHSFTGNDVELTISDGSGTTFSIEDDDSDDENELQDLDMSVTGNGDVQIDISNGSSNVFFSVEDGDADNTNELQNLSLALLGSDIILDIDNGQGVQFSINDGDSDPFNELQEIDLTDDGVGFSIGLRNSGILQFWEAPFHPEKSINLVNNGSPTVDLGTNTNGGGSLFLTNQFGSSRTVRLFTNSDGVGQIETYAAGNLNTYMGRSGSTQARGAVYALNSVGAFSAGLDIDAMDRGILVCDVKHFKIDYPGRSNKEIWYASVEGAEAGAYERGTATLQNGEVFVPFSDHFQVVIVEKGMTVMLTPLSGESLGLAVIEKTIGGFKVKELHQGKGNYSFDWEVKGVRAGHENYKAVRDKTHGPIGGQ